jgi:membrane protein
MSHDNAPDMTGSISYYVVLSLFPLVLGMAALTGFFLEGAGAKAAFLAYLHSEIPGLETFLAENLEQIINAREEMGLVSIAGLIFSGTGMFDAIRRSVNRAFGITAQRSLLVRKVRDVIMAFGLTLAVFISWAAGSVFRQLGSVPTVIDQVLSAVMTFATAFLIFLLIFKVTPNTNTLWRYVWVGAFLSAGLFGLAQAVSSIFFYRFGRFEEIYGSIAWVIILMVWVYIVAFIMILGAEVAAEYSRMKRGLNPRHPVLPGVVKG